MPSELPKLSIGMPVYNEERFLRQALDSLLAQDYSDFELTISDNASTDATQAICLEYAARDPRIRYHREETLVGAHVNFNRVFTLSPPAEYYMWAGGHDVWAPTYLSRCIELLEHERNVLLCSSQARYLSYDGKDLGPVRQIDTRPYNVFVRANLLLWEVSTFILYSVIRRSALYRNPPLWEGILGGDIFLAFELSLRGHLAFVPEPLYFLRDNRAEKTRVVSRRHSYVTFLERMHGRSEVVLVGFWGRMREVWRVARDARLSYALRIALWASYGSTYVSLLYPHIPAMFRRPIRAVLSRCLCSQ